MILPLNYKNRKGRSAPASSGASSFITPPPSSSKKEKKKKKKAVGVGGGGLLQPTNISPKMYVDMVHLNKDKLCLKYVSTQKIISQPIKISDAQKQAVMNILKGEFSKKKYDSLRSEEKQLIKDFVTVSKAKNVSFVNNIDEERMRTQVALGEISAGNTSKEILQLAKTGLNNLLKSKSISRLEYFNLTSQL